MSQPHTSFWIELGGKLGPPILAGTLVSCLVRGEFETVHGVLFAVGFGLVAYCHLRDHHR